MAGTVDQGALTPEKTVSRWEAALVNAARAAGPPLLFGLRHWVSVCLALYVAFRLELDNPYWAGTSAAIVCQPHLGASLRKGWFRMIGTVMGAVVIVVLTAVFPQNRFGFLVGLALWGGGCALIATLLGNFAAYAAALAGYTAAIVASDQLGATGGPNGHAFMLAVYRVSEIWIGIMSAGIVLAGTDFGDAPRRLAAQFAAVAAEIAKGFSLSLALAGLSASDTLQPVRRELIRRVIALDPIMDESLGESSRLRYHSPLLQGAIDGLFYALAAWRSTARYQDLIMPTSNTACLQSLLNVVSRRFARQDILLVLDGAPDHRCRDLIIPRNITLLFLPPYAPELNPKENLWDEIREKTFKHYALNAIDAVYAKLGEAIGYISCNLELVKSITSFPYIVRSFWCGSGIRLGQLCELSSSLTSHEVVPLLAVQS